MIQGFFCLTCLFCLIFMSDLFSVSSFKIQFWSWYFFIFVWRSLKLILLPSLVCLFYFINYFTRGKNVKIFVVSILGEGARGPKLKRPKAVKSRQRLFLIWVLLIEYIYHLSLISRYKTRFYFNIIRVSPLRKGKY